MGFPVAGSEFMRNEDSFRNEKGTNSNFESDSMREDGSHSEGKPASTILNFRFTSLPIDLIAYCLKLMLVALHGIINTWLPKNEQRKKSWAKLFRPSILATCREIHDIGTPVLYGHITFRFVNKLVETGGDHLVPYVENLCPSAIDEFLDYEHLVFTTDHGKGYTMIPRCQLIGNLMIQNSEVDHDDLASRGIARALRSSNTMATKIYKTSEQWAIFQLLRSREAKDMSLKTLTLTFDEKDPFNLQLLKLETECRRTSRLPLHCSQKEQRLRWTFSVKERVPVLDRTHFIHQTPFLMCPPMTVENLYIRGSGPVNEDDGTNPLAEQVVKWLEETQIIPAISGNIFFTGRFKERRIREDGSLILEGGNWRDINPPLPGMSERVEAVFTRLLSILERHQQR